MADELERLAANIAYELKLSVKGSIDSWTPSERALVNLCTLDAAKIAVKAATGLAVTSEKAQVDAQLANIKVAGSGSVSSFLWEAAAKVLKLGAAVLLG